MGDTYKLEGVELRYEGDIVVALFLVYFSLVKLYSQNMHLCVTDFTCL